MAASAAGSPASAPSTSRWRLAALAVAAVVLAALVAADFAGKGPLPPKPGASPARTPAPATRATDALDDVQRLRAAIRSEEAIQSAYARVALPFAERMAGLLTYQSSAAAPRDVVGRALREAVAGAGGVEVADIVVGVPQQRARGVSVASATVRLKGADSQAMAAAVHAIGRPETGFAWREFSILAAPDTRSVTLSGSLQVLIVEGE